MKRVLLSVVGSLIILGVASISLAGKAGEGSQKIIDAGNKTCPFLGNRVSGKDFVVYKGKRYGLCCAPCKEEFLKDPERYIKILKRREGIQ